MSEIVKPIALFRERLLDLKGEYIGAKTAELLSDSIVEFCITNELTTVACGAGIEWLLPDLLVKLPGVVDVSKEANPETRKLMCRDASAGLTRADALLAESGTVVLASKFPGDRLVSTIPPVHLVVAFDVPVYRNFTEFIRTADHEPTYTFISGPSRTADIEKILILGAHGPVRVVVWGQDTV